VPFLLAVLGLHLGHLASVGPVEYDVDVGALAKPEETCLTSQEKKTALMRQ
jgi:hypothetical protein